MMTKLIIRNCNEVELDIPTKYGLKLYEEMSLKHPQAFYLKKVRGWDGIVHFVSKYGKFKIGFLPRVYNKLLEYGLKPEIIDRRRPINKPKKPITKVGKFKLRPEQIKAIQCIIDNKIGDNPFQIGVVDATVNFGKSLLMSALYYTYKKQLRTLLITQDADWLNQSREEFKDYIPDEDITFIQGSKVDRWSNFNIGMVQSISRNIKTYQSELAKIDMVLVDEADLAGSKMYQNVLSHLYNTRVRLGLSGTIYMSNLKKDQLKNWNLESFFGPRLYEFRLKDSIKSGYSTNTIVKLISVEPWYKGTIDREIEALPYKEAYDALITNNFLSKEVVLDRLKYNLPTGKFPVLVVCKYIKHCENIYKWLKEFLPAKYNIAYVHVETPDNQRKLIMQGFRQGKIDILVSTTIIARGKNFPKLKYMINAAGMSSEEKTIQFLGRLVRTYKGKDKVYLDDIQYQGPYLSRHSRRRARYYRKEKLKVIDMYKLWKRYTKHYPKLDLPF